MSHIIEADEGGCGHPRRSLSALLYRRRVMLGPDDEARHGQRRHLVGQDNLRSESAPAAEAVQQQRPGLLGPRSHQPGEPGLEVQLRELGRVRAEHASVLVVLPVDACDALQPALGEVWDVRDDPQGERG